MHGQRSGEAPLREGDFEPLWLDPQGRCLYAALHHPASPSRSTAGVVLVSPLLHEQPRSRRLLTEVARGIAEQGVPCLRFDFFGTGDSGGDGDELDFASMHVDLDLAAAALREQAGATQLVLLAWRGAALTLHGWLEKGGDADLIVLWEPIVDGASWLQELVDGDASERAIRPTLRPGVACTADPADGQLMGFPASTQLRVDFARARLQENSLRDGTHVWAVLRSDVPNLPLEITRMLSLPAGAPGFNGGAAMDSTLFLTPPVRQIVSELGQALRERIWQ